MINIFFYNINKRCKNKMVKVWIIIVNNNQLITLKKVKYKHNNHKFKI